MNDLGDLASRVLFAWKVYQQGVLLFQTSQPYRGSEAAGFDL